MATTEETPGRRRLRPASWLRPAVIGGIAALQIVCGTLVVYDLAVSVFGLREVPPSWTWHEIMEILGTLGLLLGMVLGALLTRTLLSQHREQGERLDRVASDFHDVVQERFSGWGLTPSERDVANFMLKGFSNAEIAGLRKTSEGTIKAQSNAVYRKAGVSGRAQFLGIFIEDMFSEG